MKIGGKKLTLEARKNYKPKESRGEEFKKLKQKLK